MNKIKILLAAALALVTVSSSAQFNQKLGSGNEFMFKAEMGYMPFMGNVGTPGDYGYNLAKFYSAGNINVMAGVNISQDWFVGGGAGFCYYFNTRQEMADPIMGANVFVDMDFRPIWQAVMGVDYQPTSIKWSPLMGVRLGGSILLDHPDYGSPFTPMAECYGGINWFYHHGLHNMERNWHSIFATIGVAYMQQTIFLPIRIGWRW